MQTPGKLRPAERTDHQTVVSGQIRRRLAVSFPGDEDIGIQQRDHDVFSQGSPPSKSAADSWSSVAQPLDKGVARSKARNCSGVTAAAGAGGTSLAISRL